MILTMRTSRYATQGRGDSTTLYTTCTQFFTVIQDGSYGGKRFSRFAGSISTINDAGDATFSQAWVTGRSVALLSSVCGI